jgi:hypothetical protein
MAIVLHERGAEDRNDGSRERVSAERILGKLIPRGHRYSDCLNEYSYQRLLAFYYLACDDEIDTEIRSLRSIMVGSEESARKLEREIASLNRIKSDLQREIEELSGHPSNTKKSNDNSATAIRAFGQLTLQRNSERTSRTARARRVE